MLQPLGTRIYILQQFTAACTGGRCCRAPRSRPAPRHCMPEAGGPGRTATWPPRALRFVLRSSAATCEPAVLNDRADGAVLLSKLRQGLTCAVLHVPPDGVHTLRVRSSSIQGRIVDQLSGTLLFCCGVESSQTSTTQGLYSTLAHQEERNCY